MTFTHKMITHDALVVVCDRCGVAEPASNDLGARYGPMTWYEFRCVGKGMLGGCLSFDFCPKCATAIAIDLNAGPG